MLSNSWSNWIILKSLFSECLIKTTTPPEQRPWVDSLNAFEKNGLQKELNKYAGISFVHMKVSTKQTMSNFSKKFKKLLSRSLLARPSIL